MNNLTDYIVEEDGKFYVDVWDVDSGDPVFEQGEVFSFEYEGVTYKGMAEADEEEEMAEVLLVKE
jgi:V8-like Glu-specific endopeptidase